MKEKFATNYFILLRVSVESWKNAYLDFCRPAGAIKAAGRGIYVFVHISAIQSGPGSWNYHFVLISTSQKFCLEFQCSICKASSSSPPIIFSLAPSLKRDVIGIRDVCSGIAGTLEENMGARVRESRCAVILAVREGWAWYAAKSRCPKTDASPAQR